MTNKAWIECTLDEIVTQQGLFSDGDWVEKKDQELSGEVRLIQLADIGDGFFRDKSNKRVTHQWAIDNNCSFLKIGDILIARMPEPLGRATIFPLEGEEKYITAVDVAILRTKNIYIDQNYLLHQINSPAIRNQIDKLKSGTTRKRISRKNLNKIPFQIAPLTEQRAIVAKIEELFSELDKGEEDLKKAQEQLKIYRQAVLKKAFEGELTKEWREQQTDLPTADELLEQIKEERQSNYDTQLAKWKEAVMVWDVEGKIGKKPPKPQKHKTVADLNEDDLNDLAPLPIGWKWVKNNELMFYVTSGSRDWKKYYSDSKGTYFIRTQDIKTNKLDLKGAAFVELPEHVEGKRSLIEKGDLLMTITGANVGKVAHVDFDISEAYVSQSVALLKYVLKSFCPYLHYYFQSSAMGAKFIGAMVYGVGRPVLSLDNMRDAPVSVCSFEEQKQIVQEIESRLSVCDSIEASIRESLNKSKALRQSILKKAFEGTLLSEEEIAACKAASDYEPASVLLERIKAEKKKN